MDNEITNISAKIDDPRKYIIKATPTMIHFISRASVKVNDNFYTVEYGEDRQVPEDCQDVDFERQALIERCNLTVDNQVEEIVKTFLKK